MKKLFLVLLLLTALPLYATTVAVTTSGIISMGPPSTVVYNGQWVMQKTDFGFLWLDSTNLVGGLVQVQAKCGVGQPASATNLYVIGDCNGISSFVSSGTEVLAKQFSGQCGACTLGCGGPRDDGHFNFAFELGTWIYLGSDVADIPNSTQSTDLVGRTWVATPTDGTGLHFVWTSSSGSPTNTPTPTRTPTPTVTPTVTPTWTPGGPTATPTNTPTTTPTPTGTATPTETPTYTPTPTGNLIASLTISPNPVVASGVFLVTNTSWRSSRTIINFVDYGTREGSCLLTPVYYGQLPPRFVQPGGTAYLASPTNPGFFCLYTRWHYSVSGSPNTTALATAFAVQ